MLAWQTWQDDADGWDSSLAGFNDCTIYQSYRWGEHKARFGWTPYRFVARQNSTVTAMAQVLVRRLPLGVALAWIPGGPVGQTTAWDSGFRAALQQTITARALYCRINPMCDSKPEDAAILATNGWRPSDAPLNSGMSMLYRLSGTEEERLGRASKNWRHNLKRSQKYDHTVLEWHAPDPAEMIRVYEAMQAHKNLAEQFSQAALASLLDSFGANCLVVRCCSPDGTTLALRGALLLGQRAWDMFAATTPEGRTSYASHAAFWELMKRCAARGIDWYDLSGVDPVGNKGVYDFKKGTGATEVHHLGEWDWAGLPLLRAAANVMIKRRARAM